MPETERDRERGGGNEGGEGEYPLTQLQIMKAKPFIKIINVQNMGIIAS